MEASSVANLKIISKADSKIGLRNDLTVRSKASLESNSKAELKASFSNDCSKDGSLAGSKAGSDAGLKAGLKVDLKVRSMDGSKFT